MDTIHEMNPPEGSRAMDLACPIRQPCPICRCTLVNYVVQPNKCNHEFHEDCLSTWKRNGHSSCPVCRQDFEVICWVVD